MKYRSENLDSRSIDVPCYLTSLNQTHIKYCSTIIHFCNPFRQFTNADSRIHNKNEKMHLFEQCAFNKYLPEKLQGQQKKKKKIRNKHIYIHIKNKKLYIFCSCLIWSCHFVLSMVEIKATMINMQKQLLINVCRC